MRILVTGANGAMGKALRAYLPDALYLGHDQLDVTDPDSVWRAIFDNAPNVVIHAAAITDHQCPDIGKLINTNIIGTQYVARACAPIAKMVYLSTHYVYPGEKGNYKETDECKPIGTYAWTKRAGEVAVLSTCPNHLIVRGSWYTEEKLHRWHEFGVLKDAYCNREAIETAAQRVAELVNRGAWGVYNIGGKRQTFRDILEREGRKVRVSITRDRLDLPYPFPADSSVNTEKYDALVG